MIKIDIWLEVKASILENTKLELELGTCYEEMIVKDSNASNERTLSWLVLSQLLVYRDLSSEKITVELDRISFKKPFSLFLYISRENFQETKKTLINFVIKFSHNFWLLKNLQIFDKLCLVQNVLAEIIFL